MEDRLGAIQLQLGLIAVSVQEPSTGEEHFSSLVDSLQDKIHTERHIILYISAQNQLGLLWGERFEFKKAQEHLLEASEKFKIYKELHSDKPPIPLADLFLKVKKLPALFQCYLQLTIIMYYMRHQTRLLYMKYFIPFHYSFSFVSFNLSL